jgi:hypothetical protein
MKHKAIKSLTTAHKHNMPVFIFIVFLSPEFGQMNLHFSLAFTDFGAIVFVRGEGVEVSTMILYSPLTYY